MSVSVLPLSVVHEFMNKKYNHLRLCLYNLILYHSYIELYIVEYNEFLKRVETEFPIIHQITKLRKIIILPTIAENAVFSPRNVREPTLYIIGEEAALKYKLLVSLCHRLYSYAKDLKDYINNIEGNIASLSNNITNFKFFYKLCVNMCLDREDSYEAKRMEKKLQNITTKKMASTSY